MKKNAILTTIRTILSMIIPLITFPYITRILTVEEIGGFNFANSIISYFSLAAGLGINTYAIREGAKIRSNKFEISSFASEMYLINILSTFVAYIVLVIMLFTVTKFENYSTIILILSATLALNCFGRQWIFNVYEDFTTITLIQIVFQIISIGAIFLGVRRQGDINKYSVIYVLSASGPYLLYGVICKKYINIDFKNIKVKNLKRHIKPIAIIFGMAVATTIYINSDITILGFLKDDYTVGIYSTAVKIYNIVKQVLVAIITVTIPRLTMYAGTPQYKKLFNKVFSALTTITLPAVAGVFLLSEEIVQIVAGEKYIAASTSLRILCFAIICALFANLFGTCVLLPYNKEIIFLNATIISAIINAVLNFVMIPVWGEKAAAFTTALSQGIVLVIHFYWSRQYIDIRESLKCVGQSLCGVMSVIVTCLIVRNVGFSLYFEIIIAVGVSVVLYCICEFCLKNEIVVSGILMVKNKLRKV